MRTKETNQSIHEGQQPVWRLLLPSRPLVSELLPENRIFLAYSGEQHHIDGLEDARPEERGDDARGVAQEPALGEPGARSELADDHPRRDEHRPGVARVAHERVRPVCDECLVLAERELKGEVPAKRAVAVQADGRA